MTERHIHDGFIAYLRKNRLSYVHHRMDRKSGIAEGWPDFTIVHCNQALVIEIKTPKGRLSKKQEEVIADIRRNGTGTVIARSVPECVQAVETWMGTEKPDGEAASEPYAPLPWDELKQTVRNTGEKPEKAPTPKRQPDLPVNGNGHKAEPFYIGNWSGKDYVFARDQDGGYRQIRQASAADIINFKPLPL